jgi:hypothetical protein
MAGNSCTQWIAEIGLQTLAASLEQLTEEYIFLKNFSHLQIPMADETYTESGLLWQHAIQPRARGCSAKLPQKSVSPRRLFG